MKSQSEVAQSCPTLSDLMDRSLLGFSVHGIFQVKKSLLNLNYNGYLNLKKKNHLDVYLNFEQTESLFFFFSGTPFLLGHLADI